jgi:hypothetical protein
VSRPDPAVRPEPLRQDLHIHTVYSRGDGAVEYVGDAFEEYARAVRAHRLRLGVEVNGAEWVAAAEALPVEYFVYHCRDRTEDYRGAERLASTGRPLIIAHPQMLQTDLNRVSSACLVEINNRYAWRELGYGALAPFVGRFRFVLSSDAHQPHWLAQTAARFIARELGIAETVLF